jgi:uncharacterized membrane protein
MQSLNTQARASNFRLLLLFLGVIILIVGISLIALGIPAYYDPYLGLNLVPVLDQAVWYVLCIAAGIMIALGAQYKYPYYRDLANAMRAKVLRRRSQLRNRKPWGGVPA